MYVHLLSLFLIVMKLLKEGWGGGAIFVSVSVSLFLAVFVSVFAFVLVSEFLSVLVSVFVFEVSTELWSWQYYTLSNEAVEGGGRSALSLKTGQLLSRSGSFRPKINLIMSLFASTLK